MTKSNGTFSSVDAASSMGSVSSTGSFYSSRRSRLSAQCIDEKRRGELAVPLNLRSLLSSAQLQSVQEMEGFGWRLAFVRRNPKADPTVVVSNTQQQCFALLQKDGSIDTNAPVKVRP